SDRRREAHGCRKIPPFWKDLRDSGELLATPPIGARTRRKAERSVRPEGALCALLRRTLALRSSLRLPRAPWGGRPEAIDDLDVRRDAHLPRRDGGRRIGERLGFREHRPRASARVIAHRDHLAERSPLRLGERLGALARVL